MTVPVQPEHTFSSIFIDYENVYYHLKNRYADLPELADVVIELLMSLQRHLEQRFRVRSIIAQAYADYERIKSTPQGSLYLMGVETVYVLGTEHKNAADMRLCIDAMEVLYTRPEIGTFVIFAGDRDYIPLVRHLKKLAKTVIAVGFEGNFSGDLMLNVGRERFIDAMELLSAERVKKLEDSARRYNDYLRAELERQQQMEQELQARLERAAVKSQPGGEEHISQSQESVVGEMLGGGDETGEPASESDVAPLQQSVHDGSGSRDMEPGTAREEAVDVQSLFEPSTFHPVITDLDEHESVCLTLLVGQYGNHSEIWLTPFLRTLSDALPGLANWERKQLLRDLEAKGALVMERRSGTPYDYTVVMLNYNHPSVRELF